MKIKYKDKSGKREIRQCIHCNLQFETLSVKVRSGGEKFCSRNCYNQYRATLRTEEQRKSAHVFHQKKHKYNITKEEFNAFLISQNNKCKICCVEFHDENKYTTACVDHCHETGKVRGLLCNKCNRALGLFGDSLDMLKKAVDYLKLTQ